VIKAAFYYDRATNARDRSGVNLTDGSRYTGVLLTEYALSKSTQVYATVDYTHGTGAFEADFPGKNNQTGMALGLRHIF
jgi:predicted porin